MDEKSMHNNATVVWPFWPLYCSACVSQHAQ